MSSVRVLALALVASAASVACGADPRVVRVYDGRIVEGAYVPPEAYAAYLRGVLAEEAGDLKGAAAAYERALGEDDEDPEILTRLGLVRCRIDPKDSRADDAIDKALGIDRTYAPAFAARSSCMTARGAFEKAAAAALQASRHDPSNPKMEALVVRTAPRKPVFRDRAIALTVAHGERAVAWEALTAWGRSHAEAGLVARGLEGLARVAPSRLADVEKGALELLGDGHASHARRVAAAIADVPQDHGGNGPRDATVARLAVDDAILAQDRERVERRAVRGHVSLEEVAARAALLDRRELSAAVARDLIAADPNAAGAHMVLAALAKIPADTKKIPAAEHAAPAACALLLADALASTSRDEAARAWLSHVERSPMAPHDPLVAPLAVDLAARGVLAADDLPLELRIELAARRQEAPPPIDGVAAGAIDDKHLFLWHALTDPGGTKARALHARLAAAAFRDAIVGFAASRLVLAKTAPDLGYVRRAVEAAPAHPLLLAVAVELAKRAGNSEELSPARARLLAVARTPAEHALATE